jgi:hypothetical protein
LCWYPISGVEPLRADLGIGSHWPFAQWDRFLPEPTAAGSSASFVVP